MAKEVDANLPRPDWLPRSIISGFIATVTMAILFFIGYGLAVVAQSVELSPAPGARQFTQWLDALTNNPVINLAASSLYLATALYLVVGVVWAMVYAYWFEPRMKGDIWPYDWLKGMSFSVIPWLVSLVVFPLIVGGGLFGTATGAGPLPTIGNLILHLAYGATLGAIYGPLGDIPADELSRDAPADGTDVTTHYEQTAARGIAIGSVVGGVVGVAVAVVPGMNPSAIAGGAPPAVVVPIAIAAGAVLGGLWGSIAGLAGGRQRIVLR